MTNMLIKIQLWSVQFDKAYWMDSICISSVEPCIHPGAITNGQMEGSAPFTCVSTLKYTCNQGYWLLGAVTLKCGIDGQWDHGKPLCIDSSK